MLCFRKWEGWRLLAGLLCAIVGPVRWQWNFPAARNAPFLLSPYRSYRGGFIRSFLLRAKGD
jgi:hypothetical protein